MILLFGTAALALSFVMLTQRQVAAATAWQSAAVAAASAWQGFTEGDWPPCIAALPILGVGAILLPRVLRRVAPSPQAAMRLLPAAASAIGIVALAAAIMASPPRPEMTLALATVLLGLLTAARGVGPAQLAGILSLFNGILLGALAAGASSLPLAAATLAVASLATLAGAFQGRLDGVEPR